MMESYFIPFVILIVILGLGILGSVCWLVKTKQEDSISGMAAHRTNNASYIMILCISNLSILVSTIVMASAVVRHKTKGTNEDYIIFSGIFSPILSGLMLVFPLVIHRSKNRVGFELVDEIIESNVYVTEEEKPKTKEESKASNNNVQQNPNGNRPTPQETESVDQNKSTQEEIKDTVYDRIENMIVIGDASTGFEVVSINDFSKKAKTN